MSRTTLVSVFATALSRLHSDILLVRLKQAGLPIDLMSVFYPRRLQPNSARSWMEGSMRVSIGHGESVCLSGLLRYALSELKAEGRPLASCLGGLGLGAQQSLNVEQALMDNRIVICIQSEDDWELATILRILQENQSDGIYVGESPMEACAPAAPREGRPRKMPSFGLGGMGSLVGVGGGS